MTNRAGLNTLPGSAIFLKIKSMSNLKIVSFGVR